MFIVNTQTNGISFPSAQDANQFHRDNFAGLVSLEKAAAEKYQAHHAECWLNAVGNDSVIAVFNRDNEIVAWEVMKHHWFKQTEPAQPAANVAHNLGVVGQPMRVVEPYTVGMPHD